MKRVVVDTNVAVVANGASDPQTERAASQNCRLKAVERLLEAVRHDCVFVDLEGEIEREYRRHLSPRGQPGVGDQFYLHVLNSSPGRVERIPLPRRADGEFAALPQALAASRFDPSDRKFAALAKAARASVINAVDSDWIEHAQTLRRVAIRVENICGCERRAWFESSERP